MNEPTTPADKIRADLSEAYWRGRRVGVFQSAAVLVPLISVIHGSSLLLGSMLAVIALFFWRETTRFPASQLTAWADVDNRSTVPLVGLTLLGYTVAQFCLGRWSW